MQKSQFPCVNLSFHNLSLHFSNVNTQNYTNNSKNTLANLLYHTIILYHKFYLKSIRTENLYYKIKVDYKKILSYIHEF